MKKRPPPTSSARPSATGPMVGCGGAVIEGTAAVGPGLEGIKPDAISQRPRATKPVATIARVRRMPRSSLWQHRVEGKQELFHRRPEPSLHGMGRVTPCFFPNPRPFESRAEFRPGRQSLQLGAWRALTPLAMLWLRLAMARADELIRMTTEQILLFALFGVVLGMLLWGRFRYDLVAASGLLCGVVLGLVPQKAAFSGFSNPAVMIVALVLVASRAFENSGALGLLTKMPRTRNAPPARTSRSSAGSARRFRP